MKPKDDLFLLIKSLTKTEKGYFNKFAQMHGGTTEGNYLKLFNLIDAMEAYDEDGLKKSIKGTTLAKHLSVNKNYLFKFILRALSSFHRDNMPELQIYHLLAEERVLRARRIATSPENLVNKAAEIARKFGETQFLPLTEWVRHDQNLRHAFKDRTQEEYEVWKEDFITAGESQLQEMQYSIFFMDILRARSNFDLYKSTLEEIIHHPLLQKDPVHLSIKSRITYWGIWDRYYKTTGNIKLYAEANQALVTILEDQPKEFQKQYAHLYLNTLAALCAARVSEKKQMEALRALEKLKAVDLSKQVGLERHKTRCDIETEMLYLHNFGQPGDLKAFEKRWRDHIDNTYALEVPLNKGAIRFMLGMNLMQDNSPEIALDYFNWLLNDRTFSVFPYYPFCWYWVIIAHNEMGNKALIPSLISSAQNTSKKRLITRPAEKEVLKSMKALAKTKSNAEGLALYAAILHTFKKAMPTANVVDQHGYSELVKWLEQKLVVQ